MSPGVAERAGRSGRRSSDEVRSAVLRVAAEQFAAHPYREVTTTDIASAAGVAVSVMYRHFGSKADLFREAVLGPLRASLERFAQRWRAQRHRPDPWADRRIAEEFMTDLYQSVVEHRPAVIALATAGAEPADRADREIEAVLDSVLDQVLLVGFAEAEAQRLWFPRENLDLAIRLLVAMVFGATAFERWLIPREVRSGPPERMVKVLTDLATWGLASRSPDGAPPPSPPREC